AVAHAREVEAVRSGDGSERLPALDQLLMKRVELIGLRSCVLQPLPLHDRSFEQRGGRVGVVLEQLRLAAAVPAQVEAAVERGLGAAPRPGDELVERLGIANCAKL